MGLVVWRAAAQSQGVGGDVFGDAAACGYVGAALDGDGSDEGRVGAYEDAVADGGEVLVDAVVVAGDGSGAYVDAGADDGIAEVVEVVGFGTLADGDFLVSTKLPTWAFSPMLLSGRRWAYGPRMAAL